MSALPRCRQSVSFLRLAQRSRLSSLLSRFSSSSQLSTKSTNSDLEGEHIAVIETLFRAADGPAAHRDPHSLSSLSEE